jgi:hypothetical protein
MPHHVETTRYTSMSPALNNTKSHGTQSWDRTRGSGPEHYDSDSKSKTSLYCVDEWWPTAEYSEQYVKLAGMSRNRWANTRLSIKWRTRHYTHHVQHMLLRPHLHLSKLITQGSVLYLVRQTVACSSTSPKKGRNKTRGTLDCWRL